MIDFIIEKIGYKAVALVGCYISRSNYPSCEMDLIILNGKGRDILKFNEKLLEIHYVTEDEIIKNPLLLFNSKILVDPELRLMTLINNLPFEKVKRENSKRLLVRALMNLGKADNFLIKDKVLEASFLILKAQYQYLEALLLSKGIKASPSHLLDQIKNNLKEEYHEISEGLYLSLASKISIQRRFKLVLEFLDPLQVEIVERKLRYFLTSHLLTNAYCYLGKLLVNKPYYSKEGLNKMDLLVDYLNLLKLKQNLLNKIKEGLSFYFKYF
ncbi:hypothetical protein HRbin06_00718 [archaeon HR06]|nr:hypothetical protein HRbin06_00718 [archaeon HR06]